MLNAAIVGLGRWGQNLVNSVQRDGIALGPKIRFSRAVVRTPSKSQEFAAKQKLLLGDSLSEALTDDTIDAIVLATPHDQHSAQIAAAANAKKHVFVEKPLALTLADAETAHASTQANNLVLGVGYNRRFLPAASKLKAMIEAGSFGTLLHLEGNFSNNSGLKYHEGMWRAAENGPQSAMTAMGIHILDFFISLAGPVEKARVSSSRRVISVEVDDVVAVDLVFKSGALGFLSTMLATPRQFRVQLFGTSGWGHLRDEHLLDLCNEAGTVESNTFEKVDTLRLELEAFADAIVQKIAFPISPRDALHGAAAFEAILKSAKSGGSFVAVPQTSLDFSNGG